MPKIVGLRPNYQSVIPSPSPSSSFLSAHWITFSSSFTFCLFRRPQPVTSSFSLSIPGCPFQGCISCILHHLSFPHHPSAIILASLLLSWIRGLHALSLSIRGTKTIWIQSLHWPVPILPYSLGYVPANPRPLPVVPIHMIQRLLRSVVRFILVSKLTTYFSTKTTKL